METYTLLRAFADSWFLVAMMIFYLGACILPFLSSRRKAMADAASIPFRNEAAPQATDHNFAQGKNTENCDHDTQKLGG